MFITVEYEPSILIGRDAGGRLWFQTTEPLLIQLNACPTCDQPPLYRRKVTLAGIALREFKIDTERTG